MRRNRFTLSLLRLMQMRFLFASLTILVAVISGAVGFCYFEDLTPIDGVYVATQTVTSVGYGDMPPKTPAGRVFATVFMIAGGGLVLYALSFLFQSIIESGILAAMGTRRRSNAMSKLENHYIVCGAGRVGTRIIRELKRQGCSYVILERDEKKIAPLIEQGEFCIVGDATLEDNLRRARVHCAKGLAACLPDDAANVYVVLTARDLNKEMHIVARAVEEQAEPKLIRAGANRVVAPTIIGSYSMARALLKPAVADFMDSIAAESLDLVFEEVAISAKSNYCSKALKETNIRSELDLVIVAIKRKAGEMLFHPSGDTIIAESDLLIVIGRAESMQKLIELAQ